MEQQRNLTTSQRESLDLSDRIDGWGADLDPNDRPGVPRDKAPSVGVDALYPSIEQQIPRVKIHKSTEHGRMPPVFGTSAPPEWVSGLIRDYAYTFSEGRLKHWLLLMAADRVNMIEGLVKDLAHGHVPNIWKEMGLGSELKYNRESFKKKAAFVGVAALALGTLLLVRNAKSRVTYLEPGLAE